MPNSPRSGASPSDPPPGKTAILSRALSRSDRIVLAALAAAASLAWLWLIWAPMPDHGSGAMDMAGMGGVSGQVWSASYLLPAFMMWALMMIAMMLPSAAPMILLHARVAQHNNAGPSETAIFAAVYLMVWAIFSAVAALGQAALISLGAVSAMTLAVGSNVLAAALLAAAALYQLSPIKRACLDRCRSPFSFIVRLWRPGARGALRLGIAHGLYCLGCCWVLMLLLFVGGVMNLAWVAGLAGIVFIEKLAPPGWRASWWVAAALAIGAAFVAINR